MNKLLLVGLILAFTSNPLFASASPTRTIANPSIGKDLFLARHVTEQAAGDTTTVQNRLNLVCKYLNLGAAVTYSESADSDPSKYNYDALDFDQKLGKFIVVSLQYGSYCETLKNRCCDLNVIPNIINTGEATYAAQCTATDAPIRSCPVEQLLQIHSTHFSSITCQTK